LGHDSRDSFAEANDLGSRTLGDIERGQRTSYRASLLVRLERALQWPPGTVDAILNGIPVPEQHRRQPTEFGFHLLRLIRDANLTPSTLAEAADLDPKAVHRAIYEPNPRPDVLRRLAPLLNVAETDLLAAADPIAGLEGRRLATLALLVDAAVGDDSPLTDEERVRVTTLVEHIIAPYEERLAGEVKRRFG
jgi:transcriptional regulator with XRE-family HTH domain